MTSPGVNPHSPPLAVCSVKLLETTKTRNVRSSIAVAGWSPAVSAWSGWAAMVWLAAIWARTSEAIAYFTSGVIALPLSLPVSASEVPSSPVPALSQSR